ncbi:MAG: LPS export ABC transporter periplasmic protein LptC [Burkholderiaceae bacterium]
MNARFYDRMAAILSIGFLVTLAAGSYYLAVWAARAPTHSISTRSNEPDVFVENVLLTKVNPQGKAVFRMSATSMRHFPIDGTSEFIDPELVSLDSERPELSVTARRGTANQAGDETVLTGQVTLRRRAAPERDELVVLSEHMIVNSATERASTPGPVRIQQGNGRIDGVGMEFDNLSNVLRLSSQVRGLWFSDPAASGPSTGSSPANR